MKPQMSRLAGASVLAFAAAIGPLAATDAAAQAAGERVQLGAIAIDRTEVTIGQFRAFATATGRVTEAERAGGGFEFEGGWQRRSGWTVYAPYGEPGAEQAEPAVHVAWGEADAYCHWAGGRLPTSAEWTAAAYTEQRAVPLPPFETGRTYDLPVALAADANTSAPDPWPRHAPAGATKPGVNGLLDMGGNVWEWAPDGTSEKRTMGGSWWYGPSQMRRDVVAAKDPAFYAVYVGFRCVYDRGS